MKRQALRRRLWRGAVAVCRIKLPKEQVIDVSQETRKGLMLIKRALDDGVDVTKPERFAVWWLNRQRDRDVGLKKIRSIWKGWGQPSSDLQGSLSRMHARQIEGEPRIMQSSSAGSSSGSSTFSGGDWTSRVLVPQMDAWTTNPQSSSSGSKRSSGFNNVGEAWSLLSD